MNRKVALLPMSSPGERLVVDHLDMAFEKLFGTPLDRGVDEVSRAPIVSIADRPLHPDVIEGFDEDEPYVEHDRERYEWSPVDEATGIPKQGPI